MADPDARRVLEPVPGDTDAGLRSSVLLYLNMSLHVTQNPIRRALWLILSPPQAHHKPRKASYTGGIS